MVFSAIFAPVDNVGPTTHVVRNILAFFNQLCVFPSKQLFTLPFQLMLVKIYT